MTVRTCIIIPVYNHGAPAAALVERLLPFGLPMVLINDGSKEECAQRLRALAAQHDPVDLIELEENCGKGMAVLTGFRAAYRRNFTHALQIDADGQHDSDDIPEFLRMASLYPKSLITGQPIFDESVPRARYWGRYVTHVWVWIETLSLAIPDSMCGFRIYPLQRAIELSQRVRLGKRMDFDTDIAVRLYWDGVDVVSIPTKVRYPQGGFSNFRLWQDNILISWMHTRLLFGMIRRIPQLLMRQQNDHHGRLNLF